MYYVSVNATVLTSRPSVRRDWLGERGGGGSFCQHGSGYTSFWKGTAASEKRLHGVAFTVKMTLMKKLPDVPVGLNERLMKLWFALNSSRHVSAISADPLQLLTPCLRHQRHSPPTPHAMSPPSALCSHTDQLWEEEDMPQVFKDTTIFTLFQNKGSKPDCGNY